MDTSWTRGWWALIIRSISAVAIIFSTGIIIWTTGPAIETRFFPVVGKLHILRIDPLPDDKSAVYAAFTKERNCEYLGIAWFHGSPTGEFERVPIVLHRHPTDISSPNRPVGTQMSGPWEVSLPADELRRNSFARLSHRCHGWWLTTTDFYP